MKKAVWLVMVVGMLASVANAEWKYGVGTGLVFLNADGDIGLDTDLAGPVVLPVDLDAGDVMDYMETAFGLAGYATDGKWNIRYKVGTLELEDKPSGTTSSGAAVRAKVSFQTTIAELSIGQTFYQTEKVALSAYVGTRYLHHDLENSLSITTPEGATSKSKDIDNGWADARVGIGIDVPIAEKWAWGSSAEASFGESEGTYQANTGVAWRFADNWSTLVSANYIAVDFENGNKGDDNWYLYDVDETSLGVSVMYHW